MKGENENEEQDKSVADRTFHPPHMRVTQKNLTTPPVHLPLDLDSMSSNTKLEELHLQVGTLHENLPSLFDHRHLEESKHC